MIASKNPVDNRSVKRGKPYDNEIDLKIYRILAEIRFGTPEQIRMRYNTVFNRLLSWITIKRHLEVLIETKAITKQIISEGKKRKIMIYKINGK